MYRMLIQFTAFAIAVQAPVALAQSTQTPSPGQASGSKTADHHKTTGQLSTKDRQFITAAAADSMKEIELGRLAQQRGTSQEVKNFGMKMVDDHSKASERLKAIAPSQGVTLPSELPAKAKAEVDRFSNSPCLNSKHVALEMFWP